MVKESTMTRTQKKGVTFLFSFPTEESAKLFKAKAEQEDKVAYVQHPKLYYSSKVAMKEVLVTSKTMPVLCDISLSMRLKSIANSLGGDLLIT